MTRPRALWLLVGAGLLLVAGANAHLVYVALTSQPACVAHVRAGDVTHLRPGEAGGLSAARSACTPNR
jgi:hypothetical protein